MQSHKIVKTGATQVVPVAERTAAAVCPWKKCTFYTMREKAVWGNSLIQIIGPKVDKVSGYTDGLCNYYKDDDDKVWYAIHPVCGLGIQWGRTRKEAQAKIIRMFDEILHIRNDGWWLQRFAVYADMIKDAMETDAQHKE